MKGKTQKRAWCLLLSVLLLIGMLPVGALAAPKNSFILVAEANGELVIEPEYVEYAPDQTILQALAASGHDFEGLDTGVIVSIDGVVGNYRRSDEDGEYALNKAASEITCYRFCDLENPQPSEGLQALMKAMAEYRLKAADTQAAAKQAFDTAKSQFVGIDSNSAATLAKNLEEAMASYEASLAGKYYRVSFPSVGDAAITASNPYGKVWNHTENGLLELPAGDYTVRIQRDGLWAEGAIRVDGDMTVSLSLQEDLWLDLTQFRLSGSYGQESSEENKFSDDEFTLDPWENRKTQVRVADTFTGKVYSYVKYQTEAEYTMTAVYTEAQTGKTVEEELPFESVTSGIANVLVRGAVGNTVIYRVSKTDADGFTYSQDYTVAFKRVPTLTGITVKDQKGVDQAATEGFQNDVTAYTYKVVDSVTSVVVTATGLEETYEITVNGQNAAGGVQVPVNGETVIEVKVSAQGESSTYQLTIQPGEGKKLSFVTENQDVTMEVVNSNGEVMPYEKFREGANGNRYQYVLVPGETYSYVATEKSCYHSADTFTMEDVADTTIQVDVPTEDWLQELALGFGGTAAKNKGTLPMDTAFDPADHSYLISFVDTEHNAYVWATCDTGLKMEALYHQIFASDLYHGKPYTIELDSGLKKGTQLKRFLMDENPIGNTATIRLTKEADGVTHYQDYVLQFQRALTLEAISASCDGLETTLVQPDETLGFAPAVKEYTVTVSMAAKELELALTRYTDNRCYGESEVGYRVLVDGQDVTEAGRTTVALDGTIQTQTVIVTVENEKATNGTGEYKIHVLKSPPVAALFELQPAGAVLAVYETMSGQRLWTDENGKFQLCEGYDYAYALTCYGYVSKSGILSVTRDEQERLIVRDGDQIHIVQESEAGGEVAILWELVQAEVNPAIRTDLTSEWSNFRGNEDNNALTDAKIPYGAEEGTLYWANKIGNGIDSDAVGSPILVDGDLITYAGDKIYRVDTVSGLVKRTGTMDHKSSFSITPPTYAEGMVFVALSNGTVQAFNADTLESVWLYKDPLGGQPNSPLTVHNGYLYTGFWNSETNNANFVCLSITDEDPTQSKENKCASWYHTAAGGYYWAGAYACDDYVLIGTDDGTTGCVGQSSDLLAFDPITGQLLDVWADLNGDIRSTVVYDSATDAYYFTSKGGSFYCVRLEETDDGWQFADQWCVELNNGSEATPMSTSSPAVYNGRAYVGVSGSSQFGAYSGHNITVIDLKQKTIAYSVQTQGYPQTSGLITTAYEEESGYVYAYFFDNMTPGKIRVLRDKAGQKTADYMTQEGQYKTAYALFTPVGDHAQYAICSPIVDAYGTVYYKNDSAHLMAFGSAIKKIEVTANPDKMVYEAGAQFDPAGMVVTATYANGMTRDVTAYVTFTQDPITEENTTITISFPYTMYHNAEDGSAMTAGVESSTPMTTLTVSIGQEEPDVQLGDVNGDGWVDTEDAGMVIDYYYGIRELTEQQLLSADVNGDGWIDTEDAGKIIDYYYGIISDF